MKVFFLRISSLMSMTSYRCQALSVREQVDDDDDDDVDGMMHDAEGDGTLAARKQTELFLE